MASNVSTVDGMGFEEVNQASNTDTISGNNVYATTAVTTPTVTATTINGTNISGTNVYAQDIIHGENLYGDSTISGPTMKCTTLNATTSVTTAAASLSSTGALRSVSIGSGTAVYGADVQAGSGVLASNDAWITFPVAFGGMPTVVTQNRDDVDADLRLSAGSLNVGSFHVVGTNASDKFSWVAVGI